MKKILGLALCALWMFPLPAQASPWAEKTGYFSKTGGKFMYGLTNSTLGWTNMFMEAHQEEKYETEWEGFCAGAARSVVYTAAGLVQLVTFPIPLDFPDVGRGLHVLKPAPKIGKEGAAAKEQDKSAWTKVPAGETAPEPEPAAAPAAAAKPAVKTVPLAAKPVTAPKPAAAPVKPAAPKPAASPSPRTLEEALAEIEQTFGK